MTQRKSIPMIALWTCGVQHSVIMDEFITPETRQPIIVIILIVYSPYDLVELKVNISGIIGSQQFQFLRKLQAAFFLSFFLLVYIARACFLLRTMLINCLGNFLNYICNTYSCKWTQEYIYIYIYIYMYYITCFRGLYALYKPATR